MVNVEKKEIYILKMCVGVILSDGYSVFVKFLFVLDLIVLLDIVCLIRLYWRRFEDFFGILIE